MPKFLDKFRERLQNWKGRKAWMRYLDDVEKNLFFEYAKFQFKDLKRKEELRKLWRKIHKRNGQRDYVV